MELGELYSRMALNRYSPYILSALFVGISAMLFGNYYADDAYIAGTFAQNLASGNGFSFNPGSPSSGSTPLYTLLLAGSYVLTGPEPLWFNIWGSLFFFGTHVLSHRLAAHLVDRNYALAILLVMGSFGLGMYYAQFGMDTMMNLFVVTLVFYTYSIWFRSENLLKRTLPFLLSGVAFLVRYEAFILFGALILTLLWHMFVQARELSGDKNEEQNQEHFGEQIGKQDEDQVGEQVGEQTGEQDRKQDEEQNEMQRKKIGIRKQDLLVLGLGTAFFLALVVPYLIWSSATFGTSTPTPLTGKSLQQAGNTIAITLGGSQYHLAISGEGFKNAAFFNPLLLGLGGLFLLWVWILRKAPSRFTPPAIHAVVLYSLGILGLYSVIPIYSFRYSFPAYLGLTLLGIEGFILFFASRSGFKPFSVGEAKKLLRVFFVLLVVGLVAFQAYEVYYTFNQKEYWRNRTDQYILATDYINENIPQNATIACFELGYIGFYTDNPIIDYAGILYPFDGNRTSLFEQTQPDYTFMVIDSARYHERFYPAELGAPLNVTLVMDWEIPHTKELGHSIDHVYLLKNEW